MRRSDDEGGFEPIAGLKERSEAAPIIDLVDLVVKSAIKAGACDVHVEPMEKGVLIRHRLDGLLKEVMDLPKWVHEGLIARLKIMAGMDIAEKRLPQDGRVRVDQRRRPATSTSAPRRCARCTARRWCCASSIRTAACRRSRSSASRPPRSAISRAS